MSGVFARWFGHTENRADEKGDEDTDFVVPEGSHVDGDLDDASHVRVAGCVTGTVAAEEWVVVTREGTVIGDIVAPVVRVYGTVRDGTIWASRRTELYPMSTVTGTIHSPRLTVAEGACFTGEKTMSEDAVPNSPTSSDPGPTLTSVYEG